MVYIFLKNDLHFFIYIIVGKAESTHKKKLKKIRKKGNDKKNVITQSYQAIDKKGVLQMTSS